MEQWGKEEAKMEKLMESFKDKKEEKESWYVFEDFFFFFLSKRHLLVTEVNKPVEPEAEAFIDMFGFCLQGKCRKKWDFDLATLLFLGIL